MVKKITYNISNIIFPWIVAIVSSFFFGLIEKIFFNYDNMGNIMYALFLQLPAVYCIFAPFNLFVYSSAVLKRSKLKYVYAVYNALVVYLFPIGYEWCERMIRNGRIDEELLITSVVWIMANLFWSVLPLIIDKLFSIQPRNTSNREEIQNITTKNIFHILYPWVSAFIVNLVFHVLITLLEIGFFSDSYVFMSASKYLIFIPAVLFVYSLVALKRSKLRYVYAIYNSLVICLVSAGYSWLASPMDRISESLLVASVIWIMANLLCSFLPFVIDKFYVIKRRKLMGEE